MRIAKIIIALIFIGLAIINLVFIDKFELLIFESGLITWNLTSVLVRLFIFAELSIAVLCLPFHPSRYRLFVAIAAIICLAIPFSITPPSFLAKNWYAQRVSYDDISLEKYLQSIPSLTKGKKVVAFFGTGCKYCEKAGQKLAVIADKSDHPEDFRVVFKGDNTFYTPFETTFATPETFRKITNGRMPLILLLDNGKVTEKYSYAIINDRAIISHLDDETLVPIDIKLSQIAENTQVVLLETNADCMLSANVNYLIDNQYIIAIDDAGIFQFGIDGKFIRKLAHISDNQQEFAGVKHLSDSTVSVNGFRLVNVLNATDERPNYGTRYYVLHDGNKAKAYRIGKYNNDFIGFTLNATESKGGKDYLPKLLSPSGKLVEVYDARFFIMVANETLNTPDIEDLVRSRLLYYTSKLSEINNPVLVISDLKKKIRL